MFGPSVWRRKGNGDGKQQMAVRVAGKIADVGNENFQQISFISCLWCSDVRFAVVFLLFMQ